MAVRYPRVLAPLRDKKVCFVACGGLHNAVVTEGGQVYTWGCNDDGSLGREGNESFPALVESLQGNCYQYPFVKCDNIYVLTDTSCC